MSTLLLQLPPEIVLEIIELLYEDYFIVDLGSDVIDMSWLFPTEPEKGWRGNPLEALRLYGCPSLYGLSISQPRRTCKLLSNLCTPTLFQSLDITRLRGGDQQSLCTFLLQLGHTVKNLSLNLVFDHESRAEAEDFNACVLGHCQNVRRLNIFHEKEDKSEPRARIDKICGLSSLEEIHIIDADESLDFWDDIPTDDAPKHVAHRLLDVVLDIYASRLRTIVLFGVTPIAAATFEKIQHATLKLNRLEIIRGLAVHHRTPLANPVAWACAANLQHVSLTRCRGAHAAIFTRQLAAGAIGHLRTLYMSICGAWSDDKTLPGATEWTIPALDVLELDHFAEWEMLHFARIHAKRVFLSRVWRMAQMRNEKALIMAMKKVTTFPEVVELHVTPDWSDPGFGDLRAACLAREMGVVERDWEFGEIQAYTKKRIFPLKLQIAKP
jgi:hypothetical protein